MSRYRHLGIQVEGEDEEKELPALENTENEN